MELQLWPVSEVEAFKELAYFQTATIANTEVVVSASMVVLAVAFPY
jgi:hypothetical protein